MLRVAECGNLFPSDKKYLPVAEVLSCAHNRPSSCLGEVARATGSLIAKGETLKTGVYFTIDIGSHPHRDLEIKLFDDGEVEFYTDDCHINMNKESVAEFMAWLNAAEQSVHWTLPMCSVCGESVARKSGMCEDCEMLDQHSHSNSRNDTDAE